MCDTSATIDSRVEDLVARIPVGPARVAQLVNAAPGIDALWIPPQNWWNEALHGLLHGGATSPNGTAHRGTTSFPSAISSAASFNRSLFFGIGSAVGTEARVETNLGMTRGWTFWSPNINIFRDPRCVISGFIAHLQHPCSALLPSHNSAVQP